MVTNPTSTGPENMIEIACFITPHGFGHATRMSGILEALQNRIPDLHPHLFTTVPESLFAETLTHYSYHPLQCDIGLIQKNGLEADLETTIIRLQEFLPFQDSLVKELAKKIRGYSLAICDISSLGIAVAQEAGICSVLIENFTWDWIYQAYLPQYPDLLPAIDYLKSQYQDVDIHIQSEPLCSTRNGHLVCSPIFRRIRRQRSDVRNDLGCGERRVVLISMGGIDMELPFIKRLASIPDTLFLLAGQQQSTTLGDNVLLLSRNSNYYHPDLINAADLVICKSGYSTVAECYQAGVPLLTVGRTTFPESAVLEQFTTTEMNGQSLDQQSFLSGDWLSDLDQLISKQRLSPAPTNGADTVSEYLRPLLSRNRR